MPTFSYLAYPMKGAKQNLMRHLSRLPFCEVIPSENADLLILVTDTPDEKQEETLKQHLRKLESLKSLHMTFGHVNE